MDIEEVLERNLRTSPEETPGLTLRQFGEGPADGLPIRFFVYRDVLEELVFASEYRRDVAFAVLTGGFGLHENSGFIEITGYSGLGYVERTRELYAKLREACDDFISGASDHEESIVGFFVGCHGGEGQLDPEMARAHLSLFNVPFQPVIVLDSTRRRMGVYTRPPRMKFANVSFTVVDRNETVESESDPVDVAEPHLTGITVPAPEESEGERSGEPARPEDADPDETPPGSGDDPPDAADKEQDS